MRIAQAVLVKITVLKCVNLLGSQGVAWTFRFCWRISYTREGDLLSSKRSECLVELSRKFMENFSRKFMENISRIFMENISRIFMEHISRNLIENISRIYMENISRNLMELETFYSFFGSGSVEECFWHIKLSSLFILVLRKIYLKNMSHFIFVTGNIYSIFGTGKRCSYFQALFFAVIYKTLQSFISSLFFSI